MRKETGIYLAALGADHGCAFYYGKRPPSGRVSPIAEIRGFFHKNPGKALTGKF